MLYMRSAITGKPDKMKYLRRQCTVVKHSLRNTVELCFRLEAVREQFAEGLMRRGSWDSMAGLDVEAFHVQLRSLMDPAAKIIRMYARQPGTVPKGSFNDLRKWLAKDEGRAEKSLGGKFFDLVKGVSWFEEIREVRNALIHDGATSMTFGDPGSGILFWIRNSQNQSVVKLREGWRRVIELNDNHVLKFEPYAALYLGAAVELLEQIAHEILPLLPDSDETVHEAHFVGPGFGLLREWASVVKIPNDIT